MENMVWITLLPLPPPRRARRAAVAKNGRKHICNAFLRCSPLRPRGWMEAIRVPYQANDLQYIERAVLIPDDHPLLNGYLALFSPYGGISTNKCRRNDGLENRRLTNATVGTASGYLSTTQGKGDVTLGRLGRRSPDRTVRIHVNDVEETYVVRPLVVGTEKELQWHSGGFLTQTNTVNGLRSKHQTKLCGGAF